MEFYSSLMGDNLAELVLQSPYPKDDCAGHELWAVTGFSVRCIRLISPPDIALRNPVIGVR